MVVVPLSALTEWSGSTEDGLMAGGATTAVDDYDRACELDALAGVIPVGESGAQALVLADEPATTCYLPEHRAFLRWLAADSESGLKSAAEAALADPGTPWEECGTWVSDGPAVLIDAVEAGNGLGVGGHEDQRPVQVKVPLSAARWRVRATHTQADERTWVGLVQILPAGD